MNSAAEYIMNSNEDKNHVSEAPQGSPLFPSCRLGLAMLFFLEQLNTQTTKINMPFALVCIMKSHESKSPNSNMTSTTDVYHEPGEFELSKELQSQIIAAFLYGFVATQIIGSIVSHRFSTKMILICGTFLASILALTIPAAARFSPVLLIGLRILQGCALGLTSTCDVIFISRWAAPNERAFLLAIVYAGIKVGSAIGNPLSGFLCKYGFDGGWPSIFYISGIFGIALSVLIRFIVYDSPKDHPRISRAEQVYLSTFNLPESSGSNRSSTRENAAVPWLAILTSTPVLAVVFTHICNFWGIYTLLLNLPMFLNDVMNLSIESNGLLSGLPFMAILFCQLFVGKIFDYLRGKHICNLTLLRKIFNTIGFVISSISMIVVASMSYSYTETYLPVVVMAVSEAFGAVATTGGYFYSTIDMAPRFSGVLYGIANTFGQATGFLSSTVVGAMTPNGTREEWRHVFYMTAGIYFTAAVVYLIFGSSKLQNWAQNDMGEDPERGQICNKHTQPEGWEEREEHWPRRSLSNNIIAMAREK